ncbi:MAG: methionine--tRNA ligase [Deltaproteobacteria bacterium]|nr:methionine--tRNA ligase [Deltaproteobacteria bacterium]
MKKNKKFYITTAIDYVNSLPHIGTAYEKIGADVLARWYRLEGYDVHFQMGNDEHSANVQKAAATAALSPKVYCDGMREKFEAVWKKLDISYDGFIQTSDPHHAQGVQKLFKTILDKGDIYKGHYEGWYCESCEAYYTEKDLTDGLCPHHKVKPTWLAEDNFFFTLSRYRERLQEHIKAHPEFIQPEIRRNEILALLEEGLQDVSVSRGEGTWGIPLPNDPTHVVYVWFDALINYMTAIGYSWNETPFKRWWPANLHVIGKDITRFHGVIWPAMLMSAGLPLPQTVFGHGFISFKGEKMSKSLGNVVTPLDVVDTYGADALRYYLLREGSFGRDGDFTWDNFISRYNGDLANGLGNIVSRTVGMVTRFLSGTVGPPNEKKPLFAEAILDLPSRLRSELAYDKGDIGFHNALAAIWEACAAIDRAINDAKPWEMAKRSETKAIGELLAHVVEGLRIVTIVLGPFLPQTAPKIWKALGLEALGTFEKQMLSSCDAWGSIDRAITIPPVTPLFPRIEKRGEA